MSEREFTALGAQRCPAQARPQTKEGYPEETASENHQKGNCSQLFWLSFPPSISWCLQEHTVRWSPSLQGGLTNILLVPLGNGRQCFLLDTASLEDSLDTLHTLATLTGHLGILRGLWIFPSSPVTFPGLLSFFSLVAPFLEDKGVLDGCLCKVRCKGPSLQ